MEYEFQRLSLPRTISRSAVRRLLIDRAEYGGWELARLRLLPGRLPQGRAAPQDHPGPLHARRLRPTRSDPCGVGLPRYRPAGGYRGKCRVGVRESLASVRPGRGSRSRTRAPNSSASTGTRSSTPWNSAVKSRSAGSRSGAKPKQRMPSLLNALASVPPRHQVRRHLRVRVLGQQRLRPSRRPGRPSNGVSSGCCRGPRTRTRRRRRSSSRSVAKNSSS